MVKRHYRRFAGLLYSFNLRGKINLFRSQYIDDTESIAS